jgi:hypothetical protein
VAAQWSQRQPESEIDDENCEAHAGSVMDVWATFVALSFSPKDVAEGRSQNI